MTLFSKTQLMPCAMGVVVALAVAGCSQPTEENMTSNDPVPPVAQQKAKELTIHGDTRVDEYYWLNERENPEVIKYLEDENAYTKAVMQHTEAFQDKLYNEIIGRIKQDDSSAPYFSNGYYYYTRFEEGDEYPIYCRKEGNLEAAEEVLIDGNKLAEGHAYFQVGGLSVSPDNKLLAFGVDTVSRRLYTLYFKNLETGELLEHTVANTTGHASWANDNSTVFYTLQDEQTLRSYKVFRFNIADGSNTEVYHEKDETFTTMAFRSKTGDYIGIGCWATLSAEYLILDANNPTGDFVSVLPREEKHEYDIYFDKEKLFVRTNWEAKNFRLMEVPLDKIGTKDHWTDVLPHRPEVLLEGMEVFTKFLAIEERKDGLLHIRVMEKGTENEHYLDFGEQTYTAYTSVNREMDTEVLRYGYTSMTTPNSSYDYNMVSREKTLVKQQEVVGDFDPANYHAERLMVPARDGKKVPVSLVYRKGFEKNGKAPLLLYAYGSYGASMDPYFSSMRLSLLDRGFVFAIAHIRGGMELGREWYDDGKLLKKKNTFTDYIDCADHLIQEQYTSSENLFAMGGSAGGLLMGAVVNMRPELWRGVVAAVPFVDVVTTMLDESIPLTTGEFDEWGNPKEEEYYHYIKSYSPYDNVEAKAYPNMLVTTGLHDSQVQYWEPAKWVARLRERKTGNNRLLLHTNMDAGHGGASGRFEQYRESALEYAFILDLAGIES